ncbi:MAG: cadmium-translocating P-type ATPase [Desulfobacteraceae bacterium]|nr:cadmium-translocating P-type ATPase [Desulfobacteraceae bacterium]
MKKITTKKYHVSNINCVKCAAKIEHRLSKIDGVEFVSLDFANQTLHVKAADLNQVINKAKNIEPNIKLIPKNQMDNTAAANESPTKYLLKKQIVLLSVASLLFAVLLVFEEWIHNRSFTHLDIVLALTAYLLAGANVIRAAVHTIKKGIFFDENVLMLIATCGAIGINAYTEAVAVMIFYKTGELLQELAVSRSRRSIHALLETMPNKAFLLTRNGIKQAEPKFINIGELIMVRPGEKIPLDGKILEGNSQIDSSALTGESVPVLAKPGDLVMAGQICKTGALTIQVTRKFNESSIAKIMELVENATARKTKTENFISSFARYYTPVVVLLAACIAFIIPVITGSSFQIWIYRALVMLVISCPCALVISIPLGYFGGIGLASRKGVLVKGSHFIDALSAVKKVVFDKTGTLTKGIFKVKEVVNLNGFSKDEVMEFAAAAEIQSNHPIAVSISNAFTQKGGCLDISKISEHTDFSGKGVTARYGDYSILVGNDKFLHLKSIEHHKCILDSTVAHVAVNNKYAGYIQMGDELKPDAKKAMKALRDHGIDHVSMLTGDNKCTAKAVANLLDLDSYHAELFPEDKVALFENLSEKGKIAYVGDGVNDAPVIARADVGIAMGALGSDAAIETADVVLMTDSPLKVAEALSIAKLTRRTVWQNIILAFVVKAIFLTLGVIGIATMWEAVFADVGTALLAVANSTRIIFKDKI